MRQTLFRIWFDKPWALWTEFEDAPQHLGVCWVFLVLSIGYLIFLAVRRDRATLRNRQTWIAIAGCLFGLSLLQVIMPAMGVQSPASMPVFGYGMMVLLGFTSGLWFSCQRAKAVGYDPEIIIDSAFWVLGIGIAGGRIAFLIQHGGPMLAQARNPLQWIFQALNLSEGGLVQIGGLMGGVLGFLLFSRVRKVNFFEFADILAPAIFIGIGFGRVGCLLNGCCFGDVCDLPWAIQFPRQSAAFTVLVERGMVDPDALLTIRLHPTQVYSSINGFVLALVTAVFYWYRRYPGDVIALACILYAITRTMLEFLRSDELGQFGTIFTISQFYSVGILAFGVAVMATGPYRARARNVSHVVAA